MNLEILEDNLTLSFEKYKEQLLNDYKTVLLSRELAIIGRREVLQGRAQFGIFADGKELPQIALAKVFQKGDFRAGYYRDTTLMIALGEFTPAHFFAQLYTHADIKYDPHCGGRQMTGHFSTRSLDENGNWKDLSQIKNSSADISTTSGSVPRLLGLAMASKVYRNEPKLHNFTQFSRQGNEIAFGTIGNASCAEGSFFEIMNAAAVAQVPMLMSVWDDGYGISVPNHLQVAKDNISEALAGFQRTAEKAGFEIFTVKGWDYPALVETYEKAAQIARYEHVPVLVHVVELTQPMGHSTSGSHERYKSAERLEWEATYDGIKQFRDWLLTSEINGEKLFQENDLQTIESEITAYVKAERKIAWDNFQQPIIQLRDDFLAIINPLIAHSTQKEAHEKLLKDVDKEKIIRRDIYQTARKFILLLQQENIACQNLKVWIDQNLLNDRTALGSHLYSQSELSKNLYQEIKPNYDENAPMVDGRVILRDTFDYLFEKYPEVLAFGEDLGKIGGVNQTYEGLQAKYGALRVRDTAIHETAIIGQGIGMAMRGLRPIAEIQYLDYIFFAIPSLTDDLATVHYRTAGGQKAPLIVSTRGHRLVGIWHSGSPLGALINMLRGIHICVPRNFVQAAGFYNILLQGDDPALVIEPLNAYRLKEMKPNNIGEYMVPLGKVEITKTGTAITLVTYGSTWREVMKAATTLETLDISCEVIDLQTLQPFDLAHDIAKSVQKTNRLVVIDEDVPYGGSAYIMQKLMEEQDIYHYLDSKPITIAATEHRPPSGFDGDYLAKPQAEDIIEQVYEIMREAKPNLYPNIFYK